MWYCHGSESWTLAGCVHFHNLFHLGGNLNWCAVISINKKKERDLKRQQKHFLRDIW